jgi:hypothetical protein
VLVRGDLTKQRGPGSVQHGISSCPTTWFAKEDRPRETDRKRGASHWCS